jgi:hypothetical protein
MPISFNVDLDDSEPKLAGFENQLGIEEPVT